MNARLALLGLLLVPLANPSALASPPQPIDVVIDCQNIALPSQRAIARLTGIDNVGQAYHARAWLMTDAIRDCRRPAATVKLVLQRAAADTTAAPLAAMPAASPRVAVVDAAR